MLRGEARAHRLRQGLKGSQSCTRWAHCGMFVAGKLTGVNNMTRKTTPVSPGCWTPRWPCTSREEYLRG